MKPSLRQLRLFEATARLGQVTRAAEEQAISQSAASQALRELEAGLGYTLFHRRGRELVLTDLGHEALLHAQQILRLSEELLLLHQGELQGRLKIAASVTIACYLLPPLLARFIRQFPQVEPDIRIHNTVQVLQELEAGNVHLGLIEGPATHGQLEVRPWRPDELVVFAAPSHPLAGRGRVATGDLDAQRWVLRERGSGTRKVFDTAAQAAQLKVQVTLELNRQEAIKQSVKAGLGIGCLSILAIEEELRAGTLSLLDTPLSLGRTLSLVSWPAGESHPLARAARMFILESSSLEREGPGPAA